MAGPTDSTRAATERHLRRIAELLGRPVGDFFDPVPDTDRPAGEEAELLRLWRNLRSCEDRARALATLQKIAVGDGRPGG